MLALLKGGQVIQAVAEQSWFDLPGNRSVSPAYDGWSSIDGYSLATIEAAVAVPEGKIVVSTEIQLIEGQPRYAHTLADYVEPTPEDISDRQFFQYLANEQLITEAEALAAVQTGTIPAAMQALIDQLPAEQQFPAKMLVSGATIFRRSHPVAEMIRQLFAWTPTRADQAWKDASKL